MKIGFLLGSPDINGGTYVIFEHASRLNQMEHDVSILTEDVIHSDRYAWHPAANELEWITLKDASSIEFDTVIATWWQSVFLLEQLTARNFVYFVQSIESRFFSPRNELEFATRDIDILKNWCENTYLFPLPVITEAKWIQHYLQEKFNRPSYLVLNGIRKDIYNENGVTEVPRQSGKIRVLVEGPLGVFFKNVEKTIKLCQQANVDEIWLLTSSEVKEYPGVDRCFSRIPITKTAEIYRSCDVLVKLSYVEGMFGPPLEMFHCGGTAIVYDVTGHDEYIEHGKNSIVVKKDAESEVVDWLRTLKNDERILNQLKAGARETAHKWPDWDMVSHEFGKALLGCNSPSDVRKSTYLTKYTNLSLEIRENSFRARELDRFAKREQAGAQRAGGDLNFIQVYWDSGQGFQAELTDGYTCGDWDTCSIIIPSVSTPFTLRIDPSVRIGIVAVRSILVTEVGSGKKLGQWNEKTSWDDICIAGSATLLRKKPYPVLEAFGEDPQLILPKFFNLKENGAVSVEIELCEMSVNQALASFSTVCLEPVGLKGRFKKSIKLMFGLDQTL